MSGDKPTSDYLSPGLFTAKGRIGRTRYVLYLSCFYLAVQLAALVPPLHLLLLPVIAVSYGFVTIRRTHDIGLAGWYALLLGIPVVNLVLAALPGSTETNRFGEVPPSPSMLEGLATGITAMATSLLLFATYVLVVQPAFVAYDTRNAIADDAWLRATFEVPIERIDFTGPRRARVSVDGYGTVDGVYDAVGRRLYVAIDVNGESYLLELVYDPVTNRLEYVEAGKVTGFLEPGG